MKEDVDKLFSEVCKLSREVTELDTGYLFDAVRDLKTTYGRRIQLASNYEWAARALRERAVEFDRAAKEMRKRANRCKVKDEV